MATLKENSSRQLPNGAWVEEATGQEGLCGVERVLGTRLKSNYRYWLIKFEGYNRLMWIGARGCKCDEAIKTFLKQMRWDKPPTEPGVEYFHPSLEQPAAPQAEPQPSALARQNPPIVAPAVAPKNKAISKKTEPVIPLFGLDEEEESSDEDEQPKTAPRKLSCAETAAAPKPTASRGGGNKSKPFNVPQKTTHAQHERTARSVEDVSIMAASSLPPKPRKQTAVEKTQEEEIAELPDQEETAELRELEEFSELPEQKDYVSQDDGEQAKKVSKKRAYADSSKTPEPSTSGGGKKPKLFSNIPKPTLVMTERRPQHDNTHAAAPQLKLSVAATANAITNVTPITNGAARAAVASPTQQPHVPYGLQRGLTLLAIIGIRHEAGRTLAEVRYDNGATELVPTALLAQHEAEAKMLNAYYADRYKAKTSRT